MTLYIEYVILDNLVVDYMLFKLISITTKFKLYKKNLFFACLIGVLSAVFLPYVLKYNYLSVIYRLLSACLMVLVLTKYKSFRLYFFNLGLLLVYTFLFGGMFMFMLTLLKIKYTISGAILYDLEIPISVFLIIVLIGGWLLKKIIYKLSNQIKFNNLTCSIKLVDNNVETEGVGLMDSGNLICHNGHAVNIISSDMFFRLYKDYSVNKFLFRNIDKSKLKDASYIDIESLEKSSKYLMFRIDKFVCDGRVFENTYVAVTLKNFKNFDCIVNSKLLGGGVWNLI